MRSYDKLFTHREPYLPDNESYLKPANSKQLAQKPIDVYDKMWENGKGSD